MSKKLGIKTGAALGILSVSALLGNMTASALWSHEASHSYSYTLPGISADYTVDGQNTTQAESIDFTNNNNIQSFWNNSSEQSRTLMNDLIDDNEMFRVVELNIETYGASTYDDISLNSSNPGTDGPILQYASLYGAEVSNPAECNNSIATSENLVEGNAEINSDTSSIYSNESRAIYLCVGYVLPEQIGVTGTHENTATVTASDGVSDVDVTNTDSWSGLVEQTMMTPADWQEFVDEQVEILNNNDSGFYFNISSADEFKFNPDTFEPNTTYPDFTEGQPVYDKTSGQ